MAEAINILNLEPTKLIAGLEKKMFLIYGAPKTGKTTTASKFSNSLLLACEPGYGALNNAFVQPILKWSDFTAVVRQLASDEAKSKFKTIVIDPVGILYELCEKYVASANQVNSIRDIAWGEGWKQTRVSFETQIRAIGNLGYGIVFIAHSTEKTFKDSKGEEYTKIVPNLDTRCKQIVNSLVDAICYAEAETTPDGTNMWLNFRGTQYVECGARWKYIENRIPFNYESLEKAVKNAVTKEVELDGAEVSEVNNIYEAPTERKFSEVIEEAKQTWMALLSKDENNIKEMNEIVIKRFGAPVKISEATEKQQEAIEIIIEDLKELLNK